MQSQWLIQKSKFSSSWCFLFKWKHKKSHHYFANITYQCILLVFMVNNFLFLISTKTNTHVKSLKSKYSLYWSKFHVFNHFSHQKKCHVNVHNMLRHIYYILCVPTKECDRWINTIFININFFLVEKS